MLLFEVKPLEQIVNTTYNRSKGTGGEGPADNRHRLNHAQLAFAVISTQVISSL